MIAFLSYILKVSLSLAAFYMFYKLLCSRDTLHRFNRCLLLFILSLSAVVPFMYIDLGIISHEAAVEIGQLGAMLEADPVEMSVMADEPTPLWQRIPWQQIPWRMILGGIYCAGLLVCLAHFVGSLLSIALLIHRSKRCVMADGTILVTHNKAYGPFSWMRYIIVSEQDLSDNFDMILAHERAHIRLGHSWDLLFVQLCATAQWFNPAAWLLKRELEAIHEFEADCDTLRQGFDARQYQLRLFEEAVGVKFNTITNNFNNCSTKKRIIMMMKRQTSPWARMKALFVLPVAFVAVAVISCTSPKEKKTDANQEAVQQSQPASAPEIQVVTYAPQPKEVEQGEVFQVVEEQPMFPGGMEEMMKFLQQNVKYPKEAYEQGKQGRVIVQFVVNTDGSISNDTIVRSVDPLLDAEALRVVRSMPNWTPGKQKGEPVRVRFTLPVTFRLDNGKESTQKAETTNSEEVFKVTEELPQYPGGNAELMKYLAKNIRYPKGAQEQGIQGRVIVQFTVQKDGSITDSKVVKPAHTLLDAEALRVVDAMPKWIPAKQRGKEVACYFTIPVMFRLQ